MSRQTSSPLVHNSLNAANNRARQWTRAVEDGLVDFNPAYQRGSVWTLDQRIALIRSWLTGLPIPALIINDRGTYDWQRANGTNPLDTGISLYAVIDGQQRLRTAMAWFAGEFAIPASWVDSDFIDTIEDTDDGPYVRHTGLTEIGKRLIENRITVPVAEAKVATVEEEAAIYLLVNGGGTPQTDADMANASRIASGSLMGR